MSPTGEVGLDTFLRFTYTSQWSDPDNATSTLLFDILGVEFSWTFLPAYLTSFQLRSAIHRTQRRLLASGCSTDCKYASAALGSKTPLGNAPRRPRDETR